jgi:signal transduction histidine kinase
MKDEMQPFDRLASVTRAASSLELEPLLQEVIAAASKLTGSEGAAVLEFDERGKSLRFLAVPAELLEARRPAPIPVDDSMAGLAIQECEPVRFPGGKLDASALPRADLTLPSGTRSLLAVPLLLAGKALGVLEAFNKSTSDYTEEDGTILETLAAVAALAVDRDMLKHRMEASLVELAELDRLKSDFIAITSHELRTPLGVILGHATYLRDVLGKEHREQIDVIIKHAARLKEIVDSTASMDNYHTGRSRVRQQAVSVKSIVAEVSESFTEMAAERRIALQMVVPDADLLAEADPTKISIALGNLVKNALTFTDAGGHVVIQAQAAPGYVKVSVSDDGIGIPRKDLPRVFDRFFQVERHLTRRHNGMGLGLSVAKVMIEMHGGRLWAESVEGRGSTFSFLLPVQAGEGQPALF